MQKELHHQYLPGEGTLQPRCETLLQEKCAHIIFGLQYQQINYEFVFADNDYSTVSVHAARWICLPIIPKFILSKFMLALHYRS